MRNSGKSCTVIRCQVCAHVVESKLVWLEEGRGNNSVRQPGDSSPPIDGLISSNVSDASEWRKPD